MGVWVVGADALARSRFTVSSLAETVAALSVLAGRQPQPWQRPWLREHLSTFQQRLADDATDAAVVDAVLRPRWVCDFITVPPRPEDRTFHDELRRVRATPLAVARADLREGLGGPLPRLLRGTDVVDRTADLLEWVWTQTVRPDWPRRHRVFEADIVARTQEVAARGWAGAIEGMRPNMRWLGDGRLQINTLDYPPRDISGAELLFVPTSSRGGWVAWDEPDRYAVIYPCSGALADPIAVDQSASEALRRLLGPARALVLAQLGSPKSTTQLVALTGYGLGSVGGHLKVLLDAGLVRRRRSGRSVLYFRTRTGDQLAATARH